jgi:hypothetical protein
MERKISNYELLNINQEIPNTKLIKGTKITDLKILNQFYVRQNIRVRKKKANWYTSLTKRMKPIVI